MGSGSLEEICLSNADAISRIARAAYWLYFAFAVRKHGFDEGRQWLLHLLESQWASLAQPTQELVPDRYKVRRQLLETRGPAT
jgi:hypothetical protein